MDSLTRQLLACLRQADQADVWDRYRVWVKMSLHLPDDGVAPPARDRESVQLRPEASPSGWRRRDSDSPPGQGSAT